MWIARDKDQTLWLFENKPIKENDVWNCSDHISAYIKISDKTLFPELKWEDEPIEVDLIKKGNNETGR